MFGGAQCDVAVEYERRGMFMLLLLSIAKQNETNNGREQRFHCSLSLSLRCKNSTQSARSDNGKQQTIKLHPAGSLAEALARSTDRCGQTDGRFGQYPAPKLIASASFCASAQCVLGRAQLNYKQLQRHNRARALASDQLGLSHIRPARTDRASERNLALQTCS